LYFKILNEYLKKEFGYRINQIKLDFIKHQEEDPKYWLIDLHSFELAKEYHIFTISSNLPGASTQYTAPIKCTLCRLMFNQNEMAKSLPMKMLIDLKHHTEKRKIFGLFNSLKNVSESLLTHNCRVCNLCYNLVVQENLLIEVF